MLLRNESKVRHFIEINLTFDDKQNKNMILNEGDRIQVSYRKDGRVAAGVGKITEIITRHIHKCNGFGHKERAFIKVDMSEECAALSETIDIRDIIDINKVRLTTAPCPDMDEEIDPGFSVQPCRPGVVGMPIAPGGAVNGNK